MNSIANCIRNRFNKATSISRLRCAFLSSNSISSLARDDRNAAAFRVYMPRLPGIHIYSERAGETSLTAGVYGLKTKLNLAIETGMLNDNLGIDLVATCVNDMVATGAKPWYFHDYYVTLGLDDDQAQKVKRGMFTACCQCDLLYAGMEQVTEQPAGMCRSQPTLGGIVNGNVKTNLLIDGENIEVGDVLVGLPSSGLHSFGFSLVKRVLEQCGSSMMEKLPGTNTTLGESLMSPTAIYLKQVLDIIRKGGVKAAYQIKYGGLANFIHRSFLIGLGVDIFNHSWTVPPIFKWIQEAGRIEEVVMRETFNMGIGMVLIVSKESALRITKEACHENVAFHIGEVVSRGGVRFLSTCGKSIWGPTLSRMTMLLEAALSFPDKDGGCE